jgi:hypothetical protein
MQSAYTGKHGVAAEPTRSLGVEDGALGGLQVPPKFFVFILALNDLEHLGLLG